MQEWKWDLKKLLAGHRSLAASGNTEKLQGKDEPGHLTVESRRNLLKLLCINVFIFLISCKSPTGFKNIYFRNVIWNLNDQSGDYGSDLELHSANEPISS